MSLPREWRLTAQWVHNPSPPPVAAPERFTISPHWMAAKDIREEFRQERENEMWPLLEDYRDAGKEAFEFMRGALKSAFILNGGGIIAIPAIIALFDLDAQKMFKSLMVTGLLFISGLVAAWVANFFVFFAVGAKANIFYLRAAVIARNLDAKYFPHLTSDMRKAAKANEEILARHVRIWKWNRRVGLGIWFSCAAFFIAGATVGGWSILHAPHKAPQIAASPPIAAQTPSSEVTGVAPNH